LNPFQSYYPVVHAGASEVTTLFVQVARIAAPIKNFAVERKVIIVR
jgi:hypothetical protein